MPIPSAARRNSVGVVACGSALVLWSQVSPEADSFMPYKKPPLPPLAGLSPRESWEGRAPRAPQRAPGKKASSSSSSSTSIASTQKQGVNHYPSNPAAALRPRCCRMMSLFRPTRRRDSSVNKKKFQYCCAAGIMTVDALGADVATRPCCVLEPLPAQ